MQGNKQPLPATTVPDTCRRIEQHTGAPTVGLLSHQRTHGWQYTPLQPAVALAALNHGELGLPKRHVMRDGSDSQHTGMRQPSGSCGRSAQHQPPTHNRVHSAVARRPARGQAQRNASLALFPYRYPGNPKQRTLGAVCRSTRNRNRQSRQVKLHLLRRQNSKLKKHLPSFPCPHHGGL